MTAERCLKDGQHCMMFSRSGGHVVLLQDIGACMSVVHTEEFRLPSAWRRHTGGCANYKHVPMTKGQAES